MKKHSLDLRVNNYSEKELIENIKSFNEFDWFSVSRFQNLSEKIIEDYSDELWWDCISEYQCLSEEFIRKNINKIDIRSLMANRYISKEIKQEIKILKEII
jgi:hypothetical protein